jgi:hypothetical protein
VSDSPPQRPRVIFLVGCARTGSTLLRHVLNRSPQVVIAPETHFARRAAKLGLGNRLAAADDERRLTALVRLLYRVDDQSRTGYWSWLRRNVAPGELVSRLSTTDRSLPALFRLLIELYVDRNEAADSLSVIGEKTPAHLSFVPTLAEWFPGSLILHTFRDPRAVYASELRRRREGRWGAERRLRIIPGWMLVRLQAPVQLVRTTLAWRRADRLDLVYRSRFGERYRMVRFEDLVREPEMQLRAICHWMGIPYDASLLQIDVVGSSFEPQRHASGGFNAATAERWRRHVSGASRAWFRIVLGRRMRARGYEP